jgi:hypothetical protein
VLTEFGPGDRVTIGDGPMEDSVGQVLTIDRNGDTAQVHVWIVQGEQSRRALAVVTLSLLRWSDDDLSEAERDGFTRRRGRPRLIDDEQVATMQEMYETGTYSHAQIARAIGVSKSSVAHHLKQAAERSSRRSAG